MKKITSTTIIFLLLSICLNSAFSKGAFASSFGSYSIYNGNYKTYGLQQTLESKKRQALITRQKYNYYSNPTRRIQYPSAYNPYPNIQQTNYNSNIPARQRYSVRYYENTYK